MMKTLFSVSVCVALVAIFCTLDIFAPYRAILLTFLPKSLKNGLNKLYDKLPDSHSKEKLLTKAELQGFTGEDGGNVYIALVGQVFDVTKGRKHYGPGGGYAFFAGRDGTRAFISGDFTDKGLIEDIGGLSLQEINGIKGWLEFYHKDYTYVGKLIGAFYDENGQPTDAFRNYEAKIVEAEKEENNRKEDMRMFPPCNSEYKQGQGRRLWCSNLSGGIQREWTGVPRQYYQPGQTTPRCACVRNTGPPSDNLNSQNHKNNGDLDNPKMKLYEKCDPHSISCSFPE